MARRRRRRRKEVRLTVDSFLWQLHVLKFMLCSPGRAKYSDRDDGEVMVDKVPRV